MKRAVCSIFVAQVIVHYSVVNLPRSLTALGLLPGHACYERDRPGSTDMNSTPVVIIKIRDWTKYGVSALSIIETCTNKHNLKSQLLQNCIYLALVSAELMSSIYSRIILLEALPIVKPGRISSRGTRCGVIVEQLSKRRPGQYPSANSWKVRRESSRISLVLLLVIIVFLEIWK